MLLRLIFCLFAFPLYAQEFKPVQVEPHIYEGGWEHFVGGGLAAFDCNDDSLPELYTAGGTALASLYINTSQTNVSFKKETPKALALTDVTGAYPLDFDNDNILDLAILRVGENYLMRGLGGCEFTRTPLPSSDAWTVSFSATWEDGFDRPTLAFGNYVDRTNPDGPFEACDVHQLYRPEGQIYPAPKTLEPGYCALSMLFSDWARTGRQDLRVSNDRHYYVRGGSEQLWAMETTPRLHDATDGWIKHELWGMGIASRDITGDGRPDVYLTSMGDQRFQVQQPNGAVFKDAAYKYGITAHVPFTGGDGRPSTGWHAVFGDVQNDGRDDLFVTKGNVEQMPGSALKDPNNLLIQTQDGFIEKADSAGLASLARSRGAILTDLNLDGRLDVAVVNRRTPIEVYENVTQSMGNYVGISLVHDGANRHGIGAWIELRYEGKITAREITIGGGHAGGAFGPEHFGLGQATNIETRVIWPDTVISEWVTLPINRYGKLIRQGDALLVDF